MTKHTLNDFFQRKRLKALIIKEFFQIIRDPSTILISVVLPLFLLFLYGFGVSLDLDHLRLGVVIEDSSPDSEELAASFLGSPYFDVKIARDRRELIDDITKGSLRGFVVIPSYFSEFRKRRETVAPIQVIADGSEPNTANFVNYYTAGAFQRWLEIQRLQEDTQGLDLIRPEPRFWYNEELESRFFLIPGSLAIIMTLIGTLLTALVIAREWERGTMEAMMSTPITIYEIITGKIIPYFFLGMISMFLCVTISIFGFGLPLRGSIWLLLLVSSVFLFCALQLGLLISTTAKNQIVAYQISIVIGFLPSYILSGYLFEIQSMPLPIQWLTFLIPARYFVQSLQTLFLVGNVGSLILFDIGCMLLMGLLLFWINSYKLVKRLD